MEQETLTINGKPILTVDDAISALIAIERRFQLDGATFTPGDVRGAYETVFEREMGDAEWEAFAASWFWRKGLGEMMSERGWEVISSGLDELFDADGNLRPVAATF